MSETESTFGARLREIRISRELSQEGLGELLNTTKQVISRYETGQRAPKITLVKEYAEKLNVPLRYLLGEEETTTSDELKEYLEELKNRSEMRMLFHLAKDATKEDVEQAVKIIEALRK